MRLGDRPRRKNTPALFRTQGVRPRVGSPLPIPRPSFVGSDPKNYPRSENAYTDYRNRPYTERGLSLLDRMHRRFNSNISRVHGKPVQFHLQGLVSHDAAPSKFVPSLWATVRFP
nr:hypothetical protein Itr_chr07CG06260 [Ipomoea trifida]